jgi:hypothetical protein
MVKRARLAPAPGPLQRNALGLAHGPRFEPRQAGSLAIVRHARRDWMLTVVLVAMLVAGLTWMIVTDDWNGVLGR